ncbi:Zinc transporter ZIP1 [Amphibalanus amphitrite]|uniref:Zinc transporter ZIP1 n=1 Tax=Amphibalanus amphitrite TaxID=1232801 RepID=A0A6A4V2E4_AMPAM|nr:zinc transporter ZIP1-like [Amphibalanus amphitrite]KAF0288816.1 Zinc transporter ZIP1 [Amphibalanus amphitrite]
MSVQSAKLGAFCLLLISSLTLGLLPFWLTACLKRRQTAGGGGAARLAISCLQCLGGGVLLATVFTHMLPEVREGLTTALGGEPTLPLAELLLCVGMFGIYLLEELALLCARGGTERREKEDKEEEEEDEERVLYDARMESALLPPAERQYGAVSGRPTAAGDTVWPVATPVHGHTHCHSAAATTATASAAGQTGLASFRVLIVTAALSVHSVFEGVAIGLEPSEPSVWLLTAAIATHKAIIAFCLGEQLASSLTNRRRALASLAGFVVASPLGVILGAVLTAGGGAGHALPSAVLQALAAGTILYVVLFEIIQGERAKPGPGLARLAAILFGFGFMLLVVCLVREPEEEEQGSGQLMSPVASVAPGVRKRVILPSAMRQ